MDITKRAMLVGLTVSCWDGKKVERSITDEVSRTHNADKDVGTFTVQLISKRELDPIKSHGGWVRNHLHNRLTMPWEDGGWRLLPLSMHERYLREMDDAKMAHERLTEDFLRRYPNMVAAREIGLGDLFNIDDYPSVEELRTRFRMRVRIRPVPSGQDFRVDLSQDAAQAYRTQIEDELQQVLADSTYSLAQRVFKTVRSMADGLERCGGDVGGKRKGSFKNTLVGNVRDIAGLLPDLNLTDDPKLAAITAEINSKLTRWDAEDLREDDHLRDTVAKDAAKVADDISSYFGV
jgi:hypothetical protein